MPDRIVLVTGGSVVYRSGGTVLHKLLNPASQAPAVPKTAVHVLVRSAAQADAVSSLGASPLLADLSKEPEKVLEEMRKRQIDTVIYMTAYDDWEMAKTLLTGLAASAPAGKKGFFIATGACDNYMAATGLLYPETQTDNDDVLAWEQQAPAYNSRTTTINEFAFGKEHHIDVAVVSAPLVFGQGLGFGHRVSVQIPYLIEAARKNKESRYVPPGSGDWSVVHVQDLAALFLQVLYSSAQGDPATGYFFAETGQVNFKSIADGLGKVLYERQQVESPTAKPWKSVKDASYDLQFPDQEEFVSVIWAERAVFHGQHGRDIGWQPQYDADYLMTHLAEEVDIVDREAAKRA